MKKFEPHYRLVRVGAAQKIEKPSRQQSTSDPRYTPFSPLCSCHRQSRPHTDADCPPQGNNERTGRRKPGVQRRRRLRRRTRKNERVATKVHGSMQGVPERKLMAEVEVGRLAILLCQHAAYSDLPPPFRPTCKSLATSLYDWMQRTPNQHTSQIHLAGYSGSPRNPPKSKATMRFVVSHRLWWSPIAVSPPASTSEAFCVSSLA